MTQTKTELNHVEMYEWLKALDFYKNELKFWRKHLAEVVSKNASHHTLQHAEHFQNQVIIQEEHIDILRHDVKQFENHLQAELTSGNGVSAITINVESQLRDRLRTFEHIYVDLKHEYYSFLRKNM